MEENAEEVNELREDQPSTSAESSSNHKKEKEGDRTDEEMMRLLQATDEILENKAKDLNLSSLNVRSILHHLIKFPSTIDVLLGIRETDDLPSVRNMRSRKKPDDSGPSSTVNTPKKIALRIEDKGPKNFLDLEYEEDDEYDDDYVDEGENSQKDVDAEESEDEEDVYDEDEDEDEGEADENGSDGNELVQKDEELGEAETSENDNADDLHNLLLEENDDEEEYSMNITLNDTRPGSAALVHTLDNIADDDDYRNFVKSIKSHPGDNNFQEAYDTEDDAEDEDYNVITDNLNVEDWDETRQDKTTMIPRHEVKALMMDTLLAEKDIPISILPEETIHREEQRKTQKDKDAEVCERINESVTASTESCTLLKQTPVTFRPQEIDQLKMQLEQHVQFLTQFVVTCHHDDQLAHVRNSAQLMINELDDIRQQQMFKTILDVPNLDNAIETCHDINSFPPVDPMSINYAKNTDGFGRPLRPEAAAALSRSKAIRYPELLPLCQPEFIPQRLTHFLHEEDIMLAIALLQFVHLPRRAEKNIMDRYNVIEKNCLPARTAYQIRSHLKTMRRAGKNPIHEIIRAAEQGICNITVPERKWHRTESSIETWPPLTQPGWYRDFKKIFNVTEDRQIHRKQEAIMILTPKKNSGKESKISETPVDNSGIDTDNFLDIGRGPDGRTIILDKAHVEEIMKQLIEQSNLSPSKRRKNSTPMKICQVTEPEPDKQCDNDKQSFKRALSISDIVATSLNGNCKAARKIECLKPSQPSTISSRSDPTSSKIKNNVMNSKPSTSIASLEPSTSSRTTENQLTVKSNPPERANKKRKLNSSSPNGTSPSDKNEIPVHYFDGHTNSSFPIPPTPGRRTPDEEYDFMDLESNSLIWGQPSIQYFDGNPQTPGRFTEFQDDPGPTDFSSINFDMDYDDNHYFQTSSTRCQQPMGYCPQMEESSSSPFYPEAIQSTSSVNRKDSEVIIEDELSVPGLDMVPPEYEEEEVIVEDVEEGAPIKGARQKNSRPPLKYKKDMEAGIIALKASRKRTRIEREAMGSVGLNDESVYERQKEKVMLKVIREISQKLFMHKDTYQRFKKAITNDKLSDIEKVSRVILVLASHPELLNLVLLYAPPEAVISEFEHNSNYQSYKEAIEMIMAIERYITAARIKEPTIRSLFGFIQSFVNDDQNLTDEKATRRFYQLFGQDRPLWNKLESKFWCLPFKNKPRLENFEYIDLTGVESMSKREKKDWENTTARFETVDDIDQILGFVYRPLKNDPPSKLIVKYGEMCIRNEDHTFTQLDISERHWTRKDDITLLTSYNEALKANPNFDDSQMPSYVPDLPFGEKSIVARLKYLLAELKTFEE